MSISFIETKDPKDFPEHKELFSLIENFMGYLPHAFLLMADNPNLLNAFSGLSNEIFSSNEIDNQTKQLIALASSLSSGCNIVNHILLMAQKEQECQLRKSFLFLTIKIAIISLRKRNVF